MASIAVLPVLVGLAVDYAIQFQSRVGEALELEGGSGATRWAAAHGSIARAAGPAAPTIATAGAASAAAMLVLLLSPVPMVRGFGVLLVVGVAVALLCALTPGRPRLRSLAARRVVSAARARCASCPRASCAAWRGARELLRDNPLTRARQPRRARRVRCADPGACLGVGLALAALGWGLDTQTQRGDRHHQARAAEPRLAAGPERARAHDRGGRRNRPDGRRARTSPRPATIEWMSAYQRRRAARASATARARGCGSARLCPAFSLPDLFAAGAPARRAEALTQARGQRPARRDPAVLLPGRDHARPAAWRRSPSASA